MLDALLSGRQKFALGRLLGFAALEESLPAVLAAAKTRADREQAQMAFGAVVTQLKSITGGVVDEAEAAESVGEFLGNLAGRIDALPPMPAREPLVGAISKRVALHLSSPADPFGVAFDHAFAACAALYEKCGPLDAVERRAELTIDRTGRPGFAQAPAVDGETAPRGRDTVVRLTMSAEHFGSDELWAVPYVFFHELVCHALGSPPALKTGTWTEVWMDLVARMAHEASVGGLALWPLQATRDAATRLHLTRFRITGADAPAMLRAAAWPGANAAFEAVRCAVGEEAVQAFSTFCVAVNRSKLESHQRDEVCELLGGEIDEGDPARTSAFVDAVCRVRDAGPADRIGEAHAFVVKALST